MPHSPKDLERFEKMTCAVCGEKSFDGYMAYDSVWADAGLLPKEQAHLRCLATRLGRSLKAGDFKLVPLNNVLFYGMDIGRAENAQGS